MHLGARVALFSILASSGLCAQGTLIPIPERKDHVYDDTREILYISAGNRIERYDVAHQRLLEPFVVGSVLGGLDILPDDSFLYVADRFTSQSQGFVRKVDLDDGSFTTLAYDRDSGETGAWDVAIGGWGKGFFTTLSTGTQDNPVREIDLATDTLSERRDAGGDVNPKTHISRGSGRNLLFFLESGSSSGDVFTYDAPTDTFESSTRLLEFLIAAQSSVDRQGQLLAADVDGIHVYDRTLSEITSLDPKFEGGLIFDSVRDLLYAVNVEDDEISVFETVGWTEQASFPIGEDVTGSSPQVVGDMSMSDDGAFLFLSTWSGVRLYQVGPHGPRIFSLVPRGVHYQGPAVTVTLTGASFSLAETPSVHFGSIPATDVTVIDDQTLTCTCPLGPPGPVDVVVSNSLGDGRKEEGFAFLPSLEFGGSFGLGETGEIIYRCLPRDALIGMYGFTETSIATPPYDGLLCILAPRIAILAPLVRLGLYSRSFQIPDDPALSGLEVRVQGLVGDLKSRRGSWTNCRVLVIDP